MKKAKKGKKKTADMLPEYDFSGGVRGKYAERYARGTNVVLLEPDVARAFRNAKAVNEALDKTAKALAVDELGHPYIVDLSGVLWVQI